MATYIALCNWTDKGAQQVKDSPKRFDAAKKLLREMGGDIKQFYLTMGDYDLVAVAEAPDDAVMARFLMQLGMLGKAIQAQCNEPFLDCFVALRAPRNDDGATARSP
jgi:uncharacterized protein with GYD domain